jgi:hypothetical protein
MRMLLCQLGKARHPAAVPATQQQSLFLLHPVPSSLYIQAQAQAQKHKPWWKLQ